jgi:IMP dehydrogenase
MGSILGDISRTFDEYLIIPGLSQKIHIPANVSLRVPLAKHGVNEKPRVHLNIPLVSAAMQSVTGSRLAIALARKGGCGFIYCSQSASSQAQMVRHVKEHKAGFVESDSNLPPEATLKDAVALRRKTGHSTIAVTEGGKRNGKLIGLLTSKDFWEFKDDLSRPLWEYFTPVERLILAQKGATLQEATELLWRNKKECLPIIDEEGALVALVFRKDYFDHKSNPDELTDSGKRLFVGGALNTHDYKERALELIEGGVDALCLDSSDGYSEWQCEAAKWLREEFGSHLVIGGGNVVSAEGFRYLVEEANLDFVKVGIGGGSICITREQKGIGRGQASAVLEVASARDDYCRESGIYVPICSDGGLRSDTHVIMALAMGADFVMMGKYFAMTEESPPEKVTYRGRVYKPYWGEGANRARNWQRYYDGGNQNEERKLAFEEGVEAYVPYSGELGDKVDITIAKLRNVLCNTGALNLREFHDRVVLTRISEMTLIEGGTSSVEQLDRIQSERE